MLWVTGHGSSLIGNFKKDWVLRWGQAALLRSGDASVVFLRNACFDRQDEHQRQLRISCSQRPGTNFDIVYGIWNSRCAGQYDNFEPHLLSAP